MERERGKKAEHFVSIISIFSCSVSRLRYSIPKLCKRIDYNRILHIRWHTQTWHFQCFRCKRGQHKKKLFLSGTAGSSPTEKRTHPTRLSVQLNARKREGVRERRETAHVVFAPGCAKGWNSGTQFLIKFTAWLELLGLSRSRHRQTARIFFPTATKALNTL